MASESILQNQGVTDQQPCTDLLIMRLSRLSTVGFILKSECLMGHGLRA